MIYQDPPSNKNFTRPSPRIIFNITQMHRLARRDEKPSLAPDKFSLQAFPTANRVVFSMVSLTTPRRGYLGRLPSCFEYPRYVIHRSRASPARDSILFSRNAGTKRVAPLSFVVAASTLSHPQFSLLRLLFFSSLGIPPLCEKSLKGCASLLRESPRS